MDHPDPFPTVMHTIFQEFSPRRLWHLEIIVRKIKILGSKRDLSSMFTFSEREAFHLLEKVKIFLDEKQNDVKQILMLLLVLPYANPIMGATEENKEVEETVVYFYGEKMCLTLNGILGG